MRRISNSLRKLTGAAARLHGRGVAVAADVEEAFHMLNLKLEVLRWLAGDVDTVRPCPAREQMVGRAQQQREIRQKTVRERFAGQKVKSEEIAIELRVRDKLIRRELWAMELEPQDGRWHIPSETLYEMRQEQRAKDAAVATAQRRQAAQQAGLSSEELEADEIRRAQEGDREARVNILLRNMQDERFSWEDPLPGVARLAFKDVLPKVPVEVKPYLRTLRYMEWNCAQNVCMELCRIPFVEHDSVWVPTLQEIWNRIDVHCGRSTIVALQPEVDRLLFHPDWLTRGKYALALLWESPLCDSMVAGLLRSFLVYYDVSKLPPGMTEAVDAMLERLDLRDQAHAKAMDQGLRMQ